MSHLDVTTVASSVNIFMSFSLDGGVEAIELDGSLGVLLPEPSAVA